MGFELKKYGKYRHKKAVLLKCKILFAKKEGGNVILY